MLDEVDGVLKLKKKNDYGKSYTLMQLKVQEPSQGEVATGKTGIAKASHSRLRHLFNADCIYTDPDSPEKGTLKRDRDEEEDEVDEVGRVSASTQPLELCK